MAKKATAEKDATVATPDDKALVIAEKFDIAEQAEELREILAVNLGGETLDVTDLERIKIPSAGATFFTVTNADGDEEAVKKMEGILIHTKLNRAYWAKPYTGGNEPPDCVSEDMIHGIGTPGGLCKTCPMNEFGSDPREDSDAKACQEKRTMFFLRPGDIMPTVIIAPPGSLKSTKSYLASLTLKRPQKLMFDVVTEFYLTKETNPRGIEYSMLKCKRAGDLPPELSQKIRVLRGQLMPMMDRLAMQMMQESAGDYAEETEPPVPPEATGQPDAGEPPAAEA